MINKNTVVFVLIIFSFFAQSICFANQQSDSLYKKSLKLIEKNETNSAINELQSAIQADNNDKRSLDLLLEQYMQRAKKYTDEKEWGKALNDYRSAFFYIFTFGYDEYKNTDKYNDLTTQADIELKKCYKNLKFKQNPKNSYKIAKILELAREYPAAGFEYIQAAEKSDFYSESTKKINFIKALIGYQQ